MREARPNLNVNYLCYALRALFWTLIIINWTLIISLIFILVLFDKLQFKNLFLLERQSKHTTNAPLLCASIDVIKTTHVFDVEDFENVVNTNNHLYIRHLAIHWARLRCKDTILPCARKVEQTRIVRVAREHRIVLIRQCTPKHIATNRKWGGKNE